MITALVGIVAALAGCGGDMDVFLKLEGLDCGTPPLTIASLDVFVADEVQQDGKTVLRAIPQLRECVPAGVPLIRQAVTKIFVDRGYVVRGVHADKRSLVVVHARLENGCLGPVPACVISEFIPPGGALDSVTMHGLCAPPMGTPPASMPVPWARCVSAGAP
jgi:hypothetical protein